VPSEQDDARPLEERERIDIGIADAHAPVQARLGRAVPGLG